MSSASWYRPSLTIRKVPFLKSEDVSTFVTFISFNRVYHCRLVWEYPETSEVTTLLLLPPSSPGDRRPTPGSTEEKEGEEGSEEKEGSEEEGELCNSNSSNTMPVPERLCCNSNDIILLQLRSRVGGKSMALLEFPKKRFKIKLFVSEQFRNTLELIRSEEQI